MVGEMVCRFVDGSSRTMIWRVLSPFRKVLYNYSLSEINKLAAFGYKKAWGSLETVSTLGMLYTSGLQGLGCFIRRKCENR